METPEDLPAKPAKAPKPAAEAPARVAKIRTLAAGVRAKGFTFGKGQAVEGVPLAHAEWLVSQGQAEILEVKA